ncbi:class I SAM-dependent methyltransferase [Planktothrix paucivesiculata]|uniref:Methyltransferase n=1 Tax=Planktothrix paucivesiculata PCC 9631 TaxID=671071 RepID=A0A0K0PD92_9CYAN|nr:class I SAM-dependent methyltransferase [Planktothrix paucivesiculata]AKQ22668.1 putative methlytransferase [Planktothrix paucivesiculata PCC 9631]VXD25118.1 Putative methyltransferase [Planktothrix paucivesiculata PCC 9631]
MEKISKISLRDEWRNRWITIREFILYPVKEIMYLRGKIDVTDNYTYAAQEDFNLHDPNIPRWLNFGYWKEETTYNRACAALARKLGEIAKLSAGDQVLDVGFGFAEQDLLWVRENNVDSIIGLNLTELQVEIAQERVAKAGLSERIHLQVGSATKIPFEENYFDKVTALECAFYFNTREDFFAEAFRVLQPGGVLAVADCLPSVGRKIDFWLRVNSKKMFIPIANLYDRNAYVEKLKSCGFVNIQAISISEYVWSAWVYYFAQVGIKVSDHNVGRGISNHDEIVIDLQKNNPGIEDWLKNWGWFMGFDDYVLFSAEKPPEVDKGASKAAE